MPLAVALASTKRAFTCWTRGLHRLGTRDVRNHYVAEPAICMFLRFLRVAERFLVNSSFVGTGNNWIMCRYDFLRVSAHSGYFNGSFSWIFSHHLAAIHMSPHHPPHTPSRHRTRVGTFLAPSHACFRRPKSPPPRWKCEYYMVDHQLWTKSSQAENIDFSPKVNFHPQDTGASWDLSVPSCV